MKLFINLLFMIVLVSCGNASSAIEDNLENAQIAIDNGEYSTARSLCDEARSAMLDKENTKPDLDALCNLSILYMRIADYTDRDDNVDFARQCYIKAFSIDSVAAKNFYDNLGITDMACGYLLSGIVNSTTHPNDINNDSIMSICVEEADSEYVQP